MRRHERRSHDHCKKQRCRRAFKERCDLKDAVKHAQRQEFLERVAWFVDPKCGDDRNEGDSECCALKTFAELERRLGTWTTICPPLDEETGFRELDIVLLGDVPSEDPFNFHHFFCDARVLVRVRSSAPTVLESGMLALAVDKDRAANVPNQVAGTAIASHVGKRIYVTTTSGEVARANILRDLGAGVAHVGSWMTKDFPNVFPSGSLPQAGDAYEVVDFFQFTLGNMAVGLGAGDFGDAGPGGIFFEQVRVRAEMLTSSFPQAIGNPDTIIAFVDSIVDAQIHVPPDFGAETRATFHRGEVDVDPGAQLSILGSDFAPQGEGQMGIQQWPGSQVNSDGDPSFVGNLELGAVGDWLQRNAFANLGPTSFWQTVHAIVGEGGAQFVFRPDSPIFGETGYVPLWGNGNVDYIILFPHAEIRIEQFTVETGPVLPSLEMVEGPGGRVVSFFGCNPLAGYSFNRATATFVPPGGNPTTWANLLVPIPNGFLVCTDVVALPFGTFTTVNSEMLSPGTFAGLHFVSTDFAPP